MSKSTLCWKCNNTCGGCSWSKSFKPVKGWTAKKANFKDCGELVESYLVIDCPKFVPLKIARKGISDNKVDWYLRFTPFQSAFTKEERALVNLYLNNRGCDVAKELQMCERSVHRELNKIKEKIKRLEERRNEECQDRTL